MKKHSDIGGKEGENLMRQDFAADIIYHVIATSDINEMEANMKASLDNVPLLQIQRCVHMIL